MPAPSKVTAAYAAAGVAPHGFTSRWSYTVPVQRQGYAEVLACHIFRDAAAGAAAQVLNFINYTPSGGAVTRPVEAAMANLALGGRDVVNWGSHLWLKAGDNFECFTADASAAGTVRYITSLVATEYDA